MQILWGHTDTEPPCLMRERESERDYKKRSMQFRTTFIRMGEKSNKVVRKANDEPISLLPTLNMRLAICFLCHLKSHHHAIKTLHIIHTSQLFTLNAA